MKLQLVFIFLCFSLMFNNAFGQDIASEISKVIEEAGTLGNSEVKAKISKSNIVLMGVVSNENIKNKIIEGVGGIPGVLSVNDQIEVNPNFGLKVFSDQEIKASIIKSLEIEKISYSKLEVNSGVVHISSDLASFVIVDKMLAIIRGVDGVKDIKSDVLVRGKPYLNDVIKNY